MKIKVLLLNTLIYGENQLYYKKEQIGTIESLQLEEIYNNIKKNLDTLSKNSAIKNNEELNDLLESIKTNLIIICNCIITMKNINIIILQKFNEDFLIQGSYFQFLLNKFMVNKSYNQSFDNIKTFINYEKIKIEKSKIENLIIINKYVENFLKLAEAFIDNKSKNLL
jgi:hypothetical protein